MFGIEENFEAKVEAQMASDAEARQRDWFAARAPVDWSMAQQAAGLDPTVSKADRPKLWAAMAVLRYEYADAMLAERAKGGA